MDLFIKTYLSAISEQLASLEIKDVVASPGSRNAPLVVSMSRMNKFDITTIIDERSAAFVALGIATLKRRPVALLCTSGSALLNYAPAISDAYYRSVPLIILSADRPANRIDQGDGQTIRQKGALDNVVKGSFDIPATATPREAMRIVTDAWMLAVCGQPGPVHINIQLSEPLFLTEPDIPSDEQPIEVVSQQVAGAVNIPDAITNASRILVIVGFTTPTPSLQKSLEELTQYPQVVVATDSLSGLKSERFINTAFAELSLTDDCQPEVLISIGNSFSNARLTTFLRQSDCKHYSIGLSQSCVDTWNHLAGVICGDATEIINQLTNSLNESAFNYGAAWIDAENSGRQKVEWATRQGWNEFTAVHRLFQGIEKADKGSVIHLSNGMSLRYGLMYDHKCQVFGNRGVNGIDGTTSTAIGAAFALLETPVILLSGDMSTAYDIGALAIAQKTPNFRLAVLDNAGGQIFRTLPQTRLLPTDELEEFFCVNPNLPLENLAKAYGFGYYVLEEDDVDIVEQFLNHNGVAILHIKATTNESAMLFRKVYFGSEN